MSGFSHSGHQMEEEDVDETILLSPLGGKSDKKSFVNDKAGESMVEAAAKLLQDLGPMGSTAGGGDPISSNNNPHASGNGGNLSGGSASTGSYNPANFGSQSEFSPERRPRRPATQKRAGEDAHVAVQMYQQERERHAHRRKGRRRDGRNTKRSQSLEESLNSLRNFAKTNKGRRLVEVCVVLCCAVCWMSLGLGLALGLVAYCTNMT